MLCTHLKNLVPSHKDPVTLLLCMEEDPELSNTALLPLSSISGPTVKFRPLFEGNSFIFFSRLPPPKTQHSNAWFPQKLLSPTTLLQFWHHNPKLFDVFLSSVALYPQLYTHHALKWPNSPAFSKGESPTDFSLWNSFLSYQVCRHISQWNFRSAEWCAEW